MAHILVVDDDPAIQFMISDCLAMSGHAVETASTGSDALKKIGKSRFDLVILDRGMPQMSGIEILKAIRTAPATANLKVLICTGAGMMADVDLAFQSGANDYVIKPLNFEKLAAKVSRLVGASTRHG